MKKLLLFLILTGCYSMPDLVMPEPTGIPVVSFCYATGDALFYGTNYPPAEPTPTWIVVDEYMTGLILDEPIEIFPFNVQDYGVVDVYLYSKLSRLTGECTTGGNI